MTFEATSGDVKMNAETTMFVGSIKPFTVGKDFSLYARRLSHLLTLNRILQNSAKISVLESLGGPELIIAPKWEADVDILYDDLVEKLTSDLRPKKYFIT